MNDNKSIRENIRLRFQQFLEANDLRQTRERFAILDAIYDIDGIFSIEELADILSEGKFHVSRATLYNTTLLLVQANLLIRHPFSSGAAQFERINGLQPRSYQVCNNCHRITLIKSRSLQTALDTYHPRSFDITHRIVYVYGICGQCERALHKKLKNKNKNT